MKKAKFLLVAVNAKYIHSNPAIKSLYLFSKDLAEYMEICEYTINQEFGDIIADIYERKPDVIGFSCYLWNVGLIQKAIPELKKILPHCDIWLGGPEVSYGANKILQKLPYVRGIMYGEGEQVFREVLLEYVADRRDFTNVAGICYRSLAQSNEDIVMNPPQQLLEMDCLPFLYENLQETANRIIYYETSRGCPFGCSYCMSSIDKGVRFRSLELVFREIKYFMDNKVPQVKLTDRTFNIRHDRTEAILQYLLEHDNGVTNFHFEVAADIITESEISIMKKMRPGLIQLEIGVQTTNPQTLKAINRVTDFAKLSDNVREIQGAGNIHCHLDLIAGLPLEDMESFKKSFNDVYNLNPNQLQLGFLKVLKGAPMEQDAVNYGIVYEDCAPYEVLFTDVMSYGDIRVLKGVEEMVEVYYNSGLFAYTLKCLEKFHKTPFDMYLGLWNYYLENKYNQVKHSRISRYTILHDYFCKLLDENDARLLREVLIFDLYKKENLKTRPVFAMQMKEYKERTSQTYRDMAPRYKSKDFHIEPICVDIEAAWCGELRSDDCMVLFDYSKRNCLDGTVSHDFIQ